MSEFSEVRKCVVCGATFVAHNWSRIYCSQKCGRKMANARARQKNLEEVIAQEHKKKVKGSNMKAINELAVEAQKRGLSYGEYVGRYEYDQ